MAKSATSSTALAEDKKTTTLVTAQTKDTDSKAKKDTEALKDNKDSAKSESKPKANSRRSSSRSGVKKDIVIETYFEKDGEQVKIEDITERIKQQYKDEGHRIGAIKSLKTYLNVEERRAYYVVNGKAEDKYVEF